MKSGKIRTKYGILFVHLRFSFDKIEFENLLIYIMYEIFAKCISSDRYMITIARRR